MVGTKEFLVCGNKYKVVGSNILVGLIMVVYVCM